MKIPHPSLEKLGQRITISTVTQYAGKILQLGLSIISLNLISNFLNDAGYSYYGAVTELALFFSVVGNLGIFGNTVRAMSDNPQDGKLFTQALILRILTAGSIFLISIFSLAITTNDQVFLLGSILFLGALFFDYITSVCDAMLQTNYLMGRATVAFVLGRLINTGLLYLLIKIISQTNTEAPAFPWLPIILAATLLGSIFTAGLSFYFVRQKIQLSWSWQKSTLQKLLLASLPFGIINIINSLYFRFLPDYFAHSALTDQQFNSFNISFRISQVLSLLSTFLMFSVLPGFKQYLDNQDFKQAKILSKKVTKLLALAGALLVIFGSLAGPLAIELITHKKYFLPEFWFLLPLMLLLAAISYGYDLVLITLFALKDEKWFLKREIIALAIALCCFILSTTQSNAVIQLALILAGAILGEGFMVLSGYQRMHKKLNQLS